MGNATRRTQVILIHLALAVVTIAVYWQVGGLDFTHYDDHDYVVENSIVRGGLTAPGIRWALTTAHFSYPHPLTWLSHMLDCELFGLNAGAHHVTNLLFHVANTLLLFAVFLRMTGRRLAGVPAHAVAAETSDIAGSTASIGVSATQAGALWRSAFVAALFALHPLHVESVAWIAERKDVLSTLFWLLTMWAYVRYVEKPSLVRYCLALLCFALGLTAKPMVVTLPCVLLLMDFWPLRRIERFTLPDSRPTILRLIGEKIPFFALAGIACLITVVLVRNAGRIAPVQSIPWSLRFENIPISYVRYLLKMVWPDQLAVLYPLPDHWPVWQVAASSLAVITVSVVALVQARRRPYLLFGWLWYLGTLVPTIGLIPVGWQSIADRYTYIPLIGVFVAITWGVADCLPAWARRKAVAGMAAAVILAACAAKTWRQTQHWQNTRTLFANAVTATKDNAIAHYNWGWALLREGDAPGSEEQFRAALRINPQSDNAHNNLGRALCLQGRLAEAVEHYREAVRVNPGLAPGHFNLGVALKSLGQDDEAISHLTETARLAPDHAETYVELGALLVKQGRVRDAMDSYRRALRYNPDSPILLNNLAWLLATNERAELRSADEAVRLAEKACQLTDYRVVMMVGTLAAAYAEAGRFEEAVSTGEQARALALEVGQTDLAERNAQLMELYRAHRPYHEVTATNAASPVSGSSRERSP